VQFAATDWQQARPPGSPRSAARYTVRVETLERKALPGWLAQRLARQGQAVQAGEVGQRTLAFFADRVEGNSARRTQDCRSWRCCIRRAS